MGRQRCLPARWPMMRSVPDLQRSHLHCTLVFVAVLLLVAVLWLGCDLAQPGPDASPGEVAVQAGAPAVGDPLPRIQCTYGYTASLYAQGLSSPDGLAFSPAGLLYVAEEGAGRVSRVGPGGSVTPAISGLTNPEGIAFDDAGVLYVVEDTQAGRLIRVPPSGAATILAAGFDAPEGIVWTAGGTMHVTESNLQFVVNPLDLPLETGITAVSPSGVVTRVLTNTLTFDGARPLFWSYAGLVLGPDGLLYASNDISGLAVTRTVTAGNVTYTLTLSTTDSIFAVDPAAGTRTLFASGLVSPEGLHFSANGDFPLYVAEEDVGDGQGRLSRVERDGSHYTLCTGFLAIEDVVMDVEGRLYVSEDGSGSIILLRPGHRLWLPVAARRK